MIEYIEPSKRMSQVVVHGDIIYLAGQVGDGNTVTEQTRNVIGKIENLLEQCSSDKSHILSATIWLASINDFDSMNFVWEEWIDPGAPPARACCETKLAQSNYLIEVMIIATKRKLSE